MKFIKRNYRAFLAALFLAALGSSSANAILFSGSPAGGSPPPDPPDGLQATLTIDGDDYVHHCDGVGDTPYPNMTITCYADGSINFHYGTLWDGAPGTAKGPEDAANLGEYEAVIADENGVIDELTVSGHPWNAEWNFRTSAPTNLRTPSQIVTAHLAFKYGTPSGMSVPTAGADACTYATPMCVSNITLYMPTTGERPDIGLITDVSGEFMRTGTMTKMLYWADSAHSLPNHMRDEATGKPISLLTYPKTDMYDGPRFGVEPWLPKGPLNEGGYSTFGSPPGWTPQQAHYPELSYMAYIATGDNLYLRDLQYTANWTVLTDATVSGSRNIATVSGEMRGIAWALRNLFMAHRATELAEAAGTLPSDLLPSSYWDTLLDNQLSYWDDKMTDPNPAYDFYRVLLLNDNPDGGWCPWQADYMITSIAFGVLTGHSDWEPFYLWLLKNAIDRTNGTSGWPVSVGAYCMPMVTRADPGVWISSWSQQWTEFQSRPDFPFDSMEVDAIDMDQYNGGSAATGIEYFMTTRSVLLMAQYLDDEGIVDVRGTYPDLDTAFGHVNDMVVDYGATSPRQATVP